MLLCDLLVAVFNFSFAAIFFAASNEVPACIDVHQPTTQAILSGNSKERHRSARDPCDCLELPHTSLENRSVLRVLQGQNLSPSQNNTFSRKRLHRSIYWNFSPRRRRRKAIGKAERLSRLRARIDTQHWGRCVQSMKEGAGEKEGIGAGTRTHFRPFVGTIVFHLSLRPS